MDYVALLTFRATVSGAERDGALLRRAAWEYPAGLDVTAEWWPMTDAPHVVVLFSTDAAAAIMELEFEWNDVFDVQIAPALRADQGLALGPEVFGRLDRMQPA
jgi:hypothetical protein